MLYQTLPHTLKLAPHEIPSSQPLTKNPQQLCYFFCQTLTKDPQQVWQTLKNFDYPKNSRSVNINCLFYLLIYWIFHGQMLSFSWLSLKRRYKVRSKQASLYTGSGLSDPRFPQYRYCLISYGHYPSYPVWKSWR